MDSEEVMLVVYTEEDEEARYLSVYRNCVFLQLFLRRDFFCLLFEACKLPPVEQYVLRRKSNPALAACLAVSCTGMRDKVRRYLRKEFLAYNVRLSPSVSTELERRRLEATVKKWKDHLSTLDFHFQLLHLDTSRHAVQQGAAVVLELNMTDNARAQLMSIVNTALLQTGWRQVFFCLRSRRSRIQLKPTIPIVDCVDLCTLMDFLVACPQLQTLFLDGFRMEYRYDRDKDELFKSLGSLKSLRTLKLKQHEEVDQLADDERCLDGIGLLTGLTGLQISLKDGSTDHLTRFGSMLRSLTGLTELKVTHPKCDDGAAAALMFTSLRSLTYLDIKHCTGFRRQPLVDVLRMITSLLPLELNVRFNDKMP
jgi:hypothetical protein